MVKDKILHENNILKIKNHLDRFDIVDPREILRTHSIKQYNEKFAINIFFKGSDNYINIIDIDTKEDLQEIIDLITKAKIR